MKAEVYTFFLDTLTAKQRLSFTELDHIYLDLKALTLNFSKWCKLFVNFSSVATKTTFISRIDSIQKMFPQKHKAPELSTKQIILPKFYSIFETKSFLFHEN